MGTKANPTILTPVTVVAGALALAVLIAVDGSVDLVEAEIAGVALLLVATLVSALRRRDAALIAELQATARTDPLTGALNRRGFVESFQVELERAARSGEPVSLLIGDLDDFKQVNDRLGHMGGDMALERVSGLLRRSKRSVDLLARLGGEEFAIVLPGAGGAQALGVAERLRRAVRSGFDGRPVAVTMSLGVASYPDDAVTLEALLYAADLAMYSAKYSGKNRCHLYRAGAIVDTGEEPEQRPRALPGRTWTSG